MPSPRNPCMWHLFKSHDSVLSHDQQIINKCRHISFLATHQTSLHVNITGIRAFTAPCLFLFGRDMVIISSKHSSKYDRPFTDCSLLYLIFRVDPSNFTVDSDGISNKKVIIKERYTSKYIAQAFSSGMYDHHVSWWLEFSSSLTVMRFAFRRQKQEGLLWQLLKWVKIWSQGAAD